MTNRIPHGKKSWEEQKRILDIEKISAKNYILTVQEKQRALRGNKKNRKF